MLKKANPDRARAKGWPMLIAALALSLTAPSGNAFAAEAPAADKPEKLFATDETLALTLTAPWSEVQRQKSYQGTYPAELRYQNASGETVVLNFAVGRRGVKRQEACKFPPIRLRFEKAAVKGTIFRGQKSLKMVTHCERSSSYEQYYVLEMLAYRIYNLLTDYSFRVRPLQVTYVDSKNGKTLYTKFAFLIEDDGDVAKRNSVKKLEIPKISPDRLEPRQTSLMTLFQYLIGNVDWAALRGPDPAECCHNVKLLGPKPFTADDRALPVPYDFDSSGLVDAPYAAPQEVLRIRSVTQRLYRGYCVDNVTLDDARKQILAKESDIRQLIASESRLSSRLVRKASRYVDDFFEIARNPDRFEREVTENCRR